MAHHNLALTSEESPTPKSSGLLELNSASDGKHSNLWDVAKGEAIPA